MIKKFIEKLNIQKGDIILLTENSSTFMLTMKKLEKKFNTNIFLDALMHAIGKDGTLLIQTFDWGFCQNKIFNLCKSNSKTSFIGNVALKRDDFSRTQHPIYSFAVSGKYKEYLCSLENKGAFDKESPFNFLYEQQAKMLIIDVSLQDAFTFVHYVEEMENVNYRYNKSFTSKYIDRDGLESSKTYDMFVRDIKHNVITYIEPLEKLFLKHQCMNTYDLSGLTIRNINLAKAYSVIKDDIEHNAAKSLHKKGE